MDEKLSKELFKLKAGSKVKVNGKIYTITKKSVYKPHHKYDFEETDLELEPNLYLSHLQEWKLIKCTESSFLGFTSRTCKPTELKEIKIVKR